MDEAQRSPEGAGGPTGEALTPAEGFAAHLPPIRRRWEAQQTALAQRQAEAWVAARRAAAILRTRFGAETVLAFGSLVHPGRFADRSDIDLAEYLRFRHLVRNLYTRSFEAERSGALVAGLPEPLAALDADLAAFGRFLEGASLADELGAG